MSAGSASTSRRAGWRSPWLWIGVAVSLGSLWWAFRDVNLGEVAHHVARADWALLLGVSVPSQTAAVYFRALRWRHLTDPIASIATGPLFRATAVGFMANNLFPLRIGELLRAYYLARETSTDAAAILATVLLERVIDTVTFVLLAALLITAMGAGAAGPSPEMLMLGIPALLLAAVVPLAGMLALRLAPETLIRVAGRFGRLVLPEPSVERLQGLLRRFSEGLGSIRGGSHLFWIALHSVLIWFLFSMLPFAAAIEAMGIELGTLRRSVEAAYATLVAVGLAVSLPSAPGFFGLYHTACRIALGLFGVPWDQAVALGTVAHLTFWTSMTLLGLACLRFGRTSLQTVEADAAGEGQVPSQDRR